MKANISTLVNWWTRYSPRVARPCGAGFGAEAMADAAELQRQALGIDRLAGQHPAERDLGRGHQAQIGVFDAVDLRLRPAGNEADPGSTSLRARSGVVIGVKPSLISTSSA